MCEVGEGTLVGAGTRLNSRRESEKKSSRPALETTHGQMDGFFSPYKYRIEEVASVGDRLKICPQLDSRVVRLIVKR